MNERILELMTKCNYVVDGTCNTSREEKFAELIVRECANVAWQHTPETEDLEYSHLIKDKILENFGVEE